MHKRSILKVSIRITAAFLILISAAACKSTETTTTQTSSSEKSDLESMYWARVDSSRMALFTEADVDFMKGMIGHHAQALIMSKLAPENGASAEIQVLASRIINAQKDEIASMQQWLRDRNQAVPEVQIDGLILMIHGVGEHHSGHTNMPGMLTQEQLEELADTRGPEFDQLFLKYMIEHHLGAVTMVKTLFGTDGAAQDEEAFRLASDIQVDQITEIERMRLMLSRLSDS
ncbi:MAG: DUF305 domain-containing protein [Balneolaceae bacterium]